MMLDHAGSESDEATTPAFREWVAGETYEDELEFAHCPDEKIHGFRVVFYPYQVCVFPLFLRSILQPHPWQRELALVPLTQKTPAAQTRTSKQHAASLPSYYFDIDLGHPIKTRLFSSLSLPSKTSNAKGSSSRRSGAVEGSHLATMSWIFGKRKTPAGELVEGKRRAFVDLSSVCSP